MRLAAFSVALVALACGRVVAPPAETSQNVSSAWMSEVANPKRDALLRVRTSTLLADRVYAPLVRQLFSAMTERALRAGTNMTSALEGAEEIDVIVQDGSDPVLLMRKVPASLDPSSIAGLDGATQWRASKTHVPGVDVFDFVPGSGALYILVDRTWIVTSGMGQQRVQTALAQSRERPVASDVPLDVPVSLRMPGSALERIAASRNVRALAPLFVELEQARVELHVQKDDKSRDDEITAELQYAGLDQAARAEEVVTDLLGAFSRRGGKRWEWLSDAKVERKGQQVTARAKLPAWALIALADVDSGPL